MFNIHSHYKWYKTYVLCECGLPCEECVCLVLICACFLCRELHVVQMVERLLSMQEVLGLMPIFFPMIVVFDDSVLQCAEGFCTLSDEGLHMYAGCSSDGSK